MTRKPLRLATRLGQTTTEYTLLVGLVAVPLSVIFMRVTSKFFAGLIVQIVSKFSGMY
jgi:hypothetical protein